MKILKYAATVWKETEGYVSKCPELGVTSCGDSFEDALNNLKEAVDLYLENAKELGLIEEVTESMTDKEKYTAYLEAVI
ncbi:MAG: type II toxin-antitoxin system HicB family antitoxin [Deltaproteobacteria bacterium]|nr:type II toxin-antitoxin system HicB family antitoxin [Deltaproteobacteria bacterium]